MQICNKNWKLTTSGKSVAAVPRARDGGAFFQAINHRANFNELIARTESALRLVIRYRWIAAWRYEHYDYKVLMGQQSYGGWRRLSARKLLLVTSELSDDSPLVSVTQNSLKTPECSGDSALHKTTAKTKPRRTNSKLRTHPNAPCRNLNWISVRVGTRFIEQLGNASSCSICGIFKFSFLFAPSRNCQFHLLHVRSSCAFWSNE